MEYTFSRGTSTTIPTSSVCHQTTYTSGDCDCSYTFLNSEWFWGGSCEVEFPGTIVEAPYFFFIKKAEKRYLNSKEKEKYKNWKGKVLIDGELCDLIWPDRDEVPYYNINKGVH